MMTRLTLLLAGLVGVLFWCLGCSNTRIVASDSLTFDASIHWQRQEPSHPSRRLEFCIPSNDPQVEDAHLIVWSFPQLRDGGDGQIVDKTLEQWSAQFLGDDGNASSATVLRGEYVINGLPVHTIDVRGRFIAETWPGADLHHDKAYYRLMGAYIVGPQGDYAVKFLGPDTLLAQHADAFDEFVRSARMRDPSRPPSDPFRTGNPRTQLTAIRK